MAYKNSKIRIAMGVCFVCNEANSVVIDQKVRSENTEDLPHYVITGDICDKSRVILHLLQYVMAINQI